MTSFVFHFYFHGCFIYPEVSNLSLILYTSLQQFFSFASGWFLVTLFTSSFLFHAVPLLYISSMFDIRFSFFIFLQPFKKKNLSLHVARNPIQVQIYKSRLTFDQVNEYECR